MGVEGDIRRVFACYSQGQMGADYQNELEKASSQFEAPPGAHIRDHKQNPIENGAYEALRNVIFGTLKAFSVAQIRVVEMRA